MKTSELLKNRHSIKDFLSQLLTQAEISKSEKIEVPFLLFKHLSNKKSEIRNLVNQFTEEGLIKIQGVLSVDGKNILPVNFFDTELSIDLPVNTVETICLTINKKKIENLIIQKPQSENPAIFTLERNGKIHRTVDGEVESCLFKPNKGAFQIIKILAERRREPLSSSTILDEIKDKIAKKKKEMNVRYVRDTILKIRKVMKKQFTGINLDDFIPPADENDGYALNDNIKIKTSNS